MANPEHLEILKQGRIAWNMWREENPDVRVDLSNTDLSNEYVDRNKHLEDFDYRHSYHTLPEVHGIIVERANLYDINFDNANLVQTKLSGADLYNSSFKNSDLTKADLRDVFCLPCPYCLPALWRCEDNATPSPKSASAL